MASMQTVKPPKWDMQEELPDHLNFMLRFKVVPCTEYRLGNCCASNCFEYHEDDEMRRPLVDNEGNLLYWDQLCDYTSNRQPCPYGYLCPFAHTQAERENHPGQFLASQDGCLNKGVRNQAHRYTYPFPHGEEPKLIKYRFCAHYPNVDNCRRREFCAFAHCRQELTVPLLTQEEEQKRALSNDFFTKKFKIYWCPIGVQHDWQTCVYAHNYQDARRNPDIGYGPRPCPYWEKKKDRAPGYEKRCPNGFACPYAHGAKEQLYHPLYFKTVVCWDFSQSKACPRRDLCAFYHARKLQRKPPDDSTNYNVALEDEDMQALQPYFRNPPAFTQDEKKRDWEQGGRYPHEQMYDPREISPMGGPREISPMGGMLGGITPCFMGVQQESQPASPLAFLPPSPMHNTSKQGLALTPVNMGVAPCPYDSKIPVPCLLDGTGSPMNQVPVPVFPGDGDSPSYFETYETDYFAGADGEKATEPFNFIGGESIWYNQTPNNQKPGLHFRMNSGTTVSGTGSSHTSASDSDSGPESSFPLLPNLREDGPCAYPSVPENEAVLAGR